MTISAYRILTKNTYTGGMTMEAVGAYIREMREGRNESRASVAHVVGTHESQLVRIEKGQQDARGSLLLAIVHHVGGDTNIVFELMAPDKTAKDGIEEARTLLNRRKRLLDSIDDEAVEDLENLMADFHQSIQDPLFLRAYIAFRDFWRRVFGRMKTQ